MEEVVLERAIQIAVQAHSSQKEKNGNPYILHPLRLMMKMLGELEMSAAILHDVVEDTEWTLEDLRREDFPEAVIEAVDCLTHRKQIRYRDYIQRISKNPIARKVKIADLEDNLDVKRLPDLTMRDQARMKKYHRAWLLLRNVQRSEAGGFQ
ncbi:MAG: bifunctional (p)ppGpp synthetase/guanosine-3',5'-bis(diphosphate) 3'-pyrophosphohydrolase [Spirochaetaceae bacterium]|nr:MAG: bifunctional (p)ppGpp synthetase/guanosine-3',5'-bis(diphosphate) 3'-pyrophosphohydrolase [Spirochaetaceae bacterium]